MSTALTGFDDAPLIHGIQKQPHSNTFPTYVPDEDVHRNGEGDG